MYYGAYSDKPQGKEHMVEYTEMETRSVCEGGTMETAVAVSAMMGTSGIASRNLARGGS
jgi:hypothetical protein